MLASFANVFGMDTLMILALLAITCATPLTLGIVIVMLIRRNERRNPPLPPPPRRKDPS